MGASRGENPRIGRGAWQMRGATGFSPEGEGIWAGEGGWRSSILSIGNSTEPGGGDDGPSEAKRRAYGAGRGFVSFVTLGGGRLDRHTAREASHMARDHCGSRRV